MPTNSYNGGIVIPNPHRVEHVGITTVSLPDKVVLPLNESITDKAVPCVSIGEKVLTGQVIATNKDYDSVPIHATISGQVTAIDDQLIAHKSGLKTLCITIQSDGKDEWIEHQDAIDNYLNLAPSVLISKIRQAGIVGMGGAGFPTHIKLGLFGLANTCKTIIINGTECEPGIMCDDALMQSHPEKIIIGVKVLLHICGAEKAIIAIEDDKIDALSALNKHINDERISTELIPTKYTSGSEKLLIKALFNREISSGGFAIEEGVVCQNISTVKAIFDAIIDSKPLVSRIVTVTGSGISSPDNYEVRLGSSFDNIASLSKLSNEKHSIRIGGMMMGIDLHTMSVPISKTSNCIFINNETPKNDVKECIRCGSCNQACPVGLLPQQLYWYSKGENTEKAIDYNLLDCIECACCSYVCPSHIPLVNYYSFAKALHFKKIEEQKKTDIARERFEYREYRLDRNKIERAEMMEAKKKAIKEKMAKEKSQKDKIAAAMERVGTNKNNNKNE